MSVPDRAQRSPLLSVKSFSLPLTLVQNQAKRLSYLVVMYRIAYQIIVQHELVHFISAIMPTRTDVDLS